MSLLLSGLYSNVRTLVCVYNSRNVKIPVSVFEISPRTNKPPRNESNFITTSGLHNNIHGNWLAKLYNVFTSVSHGPCTYIIHKKPFFKEWNNHISRKVMIKYCEYLETKYPKGKLIPVEQRGHG